MGVLKSEPETLAHPLANDFVRKCLLHRVSEQHF